MMFRKVQRVCVIRIYYTLRTEALSWRPSHAMIQIGYTIAGEKLIGTVIRDDRFARFRERSKLLGFKVK